METQRPDKTTEVMSLVDLQKFLANELADESDPSFHRAFTPLTDGLGLESPKKREDLFAEAPLPDPVVEKKIEPPPLKVESVVGPPQSKEPQVMRAPKVDLDSDEMPPVDSLIADKIKPADIFPVEEKKEPVTAPIAIPPPMPSVSFFRRLQAGIIDQILVLSLWAVAVGITSQILSKGEDPFLTRLLQDFSSPVFIRFALLEFLAVWLAYFAVCLGAMDMTLGMWVWGMRIGYGEGSKGWKKWRRIVLSLGLVAPIFPSLFLVIRFHGRNLLDGLSGTSLYRA